MRLRCLMCLGLLGCATAPVGPLPSSVEEVPTEPTEPARVASSEVVFQEVHDSPIRTLLAEPGWPHFVSVSGGVVAVHDAATGAVRAWRRPWPRENVAVSHNASGTLLLLTPMSPYEQTALVWSLEDDRTYVLTHEDPTTNAPELRIDARGERLLVMGGRPEAYRLSVEEVGTRRPLATRSYTGFPRAEFTPDGSTVVVAEVLPGHGGTNVTLVDPLTLETRARLGNTQRPAVLKRSNAVVLVTTEGIELRSTRDGSLLGQIPRSEQHGVTAVAPHEAYDGSCLGMPIPETPRVRLYRATDLTFVHEVDTTSFGSYALLPGCAGLIGQSHAGELRTFGPGLPSDGAPFGSLGTLPNTLGASLPPVALVAADSAVAANDYAYAGIVRGASAPRFRVVPGDVLHTRSPWSFGFLTSGAVFVVGRGFVHTIGREGLAPDVCQGPADVMVSPSGTTSLGTRSLFCDLERQRSQRVVVDVPTQAGRFVMVFDEDGGAHALDIEQGTTTPIAAGVAPYSSPVAISESGRVVAYAHSSGTSVRLAEGAPQQARAAPLAQRHRATRRTLYDTMLAVESADRITLYAFDGSVPVDREIDAARFVPPTPTRSTFLISDGAHTDVIEARTGVTLATFDGAPVSEVFVGRPFEPEPRLALPIIRHGAETAFVRVTDGRASRLSLGDVRVLGSDPLERFLAVCGAGALSVMEVSSQASRSFGTCLDSDQVRVRGDGGALLIVSGVRLALRTPASETVLSVLDRGEVPLLFVTNNTGAYTGSAELVARMRFRRAGPLLSAPLEPLTQGRETPALLAQLGVTP